MSRKRIARTMNLKDLLTHFSTEDTCITWLEQTRWQGQPVCPHCHGTERITRYTGKPFTYFHNQCRKAFTVKTGTVMHSSKTPTVNWIITIYAVLTGRKGVSAMQLSKELGVQYRTAWYLLHRVREACASGELQLTNIVEIDETYIGGLEKNKPMKKRQKQGRGPVGKQAVLGLRQRGGKTIAKPISSTDAQTLHREIQRYVDPQSVVCTDDHRSYQGLSNVVSFHDTVKHSVGEYGKGFVHTNSMESVWSVLKRALHGTYHHVSRKHLHRYVNEATFRLNEGNCEVDTLDRMQAIAVNMSGKRIPYRELVA